MGIRVGMVTMGDWVGNKYILMICLKLTQPPKFTTPLHPLQLKHHSNTSKFTTPLHPLHLKHHSNTSKSTKPLHPLHLKHHSYSSKSTTPLHLKHHSYTPTPQTPPLHLYTPLHRQTYLGAYVTQYHMS